MLTYRVVYSNAKPNGGQWRAATGDGVSSVFLSFGVCTEGATVRASAPF